MAKEWLQKHKKALTEGVIAKVATSPILYSGLYVHAGYNLAEGRPGLAALEAVAGTGSATVRRVRRVFRNAREKVELIEKAYEEGVRDGIEEVTQNRNFERPVKPFDRRVIHTTPKGVQVLVGTSENSVK